MKQLYTLLIFVFGLQFGFGQIGFEENYIIDGREFVNDPKGIFTADFDGDGDLDVLTGSNDKIVWFENTDGNGHFKVKQVISTEQSPIENIYAADLDGDGDMDVISGVGDSISGTIVWYENTNGLGDFGDRIILPQLTSSRPTLVHAADIDSDGDIDVLATSYIQGRIWWYENLGGNGNFSERSQLAMDTNGNTSSDLSSFNTFDLDGDGDLDIISAHIGDDKIAWYENLDGLGDFGQQQLISNQANGPGSIYAVDLDTDGDIDVLSASLYDNKIAWYENLDGNGSYGSQQVISTNVSFPKSVYSNDFDGDGDMDVISASAIDNKIAWYENLDGNGSFGSQQIITINANFAVSVYSGDFNGDGDIDILSASRNDDKIAWYENTDGQGNFGIPQIISAIVYRLTSTHASDIDGDGDVDVLCASRGDGKIAWYENIDGEGSFNPSLQRLITSGSAGFYSVYSSDIDGDGDMDVLAASLNSDLILWYENIDGLGDFGQQQLITTDADGAQNVYAVDIDGDGDIDVVSASSYDNKIAWYENLNGLGNFGSQQIITTNASFAISVYSSDLDGDGDMDILSASFNDSKIAWYENTDGQGNFGSQQIIATDVVGAQSVYSADIDGDGDMDILSASYSEDKIDWYENINGLGSFSSRIEISQNVSLANNVSAMDMDNDGDIDVITTNPSGVSWFENIDGLGSFGVRQNMADNINAEEAESLNVIDVDGDGDMDVVAAFSRDNTGPKDNIIWFRNLGIQQNEINGNLKMDINSDGCNTSDVSINNLLIETTDGSNSISTFSLANGLYQLFPDEGNYTTSIISELSNYYTSNPISQISNFVGVGNSEMIDFCIEPSGVYDDLNISVYPNIDDPRPGFDTTYQIVYKNVGTTVLSGSVSFEFDDSKIQFLSASEAVSSQTTSTLNFDFTDLNPFETRTIDLEFNVFPPPTTNIDDILLSTATINPVTGDETIDDNIFALEQTVIGSYDPNDIRVLEGDEIFIDDIEKYLHYIIRFQNTGTASAINVRVEHILDDKLDWTTMQLESLSHTGRVEISDGNNVQFIFDDIFLPDSTTDEVGSNGFIAFRIKPKSNVQVGDIFTGVADIYFDFNPPIITNTVNTEIVEPLSIDEFELNSIKLYPNPVTERLNITSTLVFDTLRIVDVNGRELNRIEVSTEDYSLDVSELSKGIYFLEIQSGNSKSTMKFVKN